MKKEDVKMGSVLTVRDDLKMDVYYGCNNITDGMKLQLGKRLTITRKCEGYGFKIKEDDGIWSWTWEMFKESQEPSITKLVQKVITNKNATIVFFTDDTKQIVKHTDDLPYDLEKAVAMACAKKLLGGYTEFEKVMDSVESKELSLESRLLRGDTIRFKESEDVCEFCVVLKGKRISVTWNSGVSGYHYSLKQVLYFFENGIWVEIKPQFYKQK